MDYDETKQALDAIEEHLSRESEKINSEDAWCQYLEKTREGLIEALSILLEDYKKAQIDSMGVLYSKPAVRKKFGLGEELNLEKLDCFKGDEKLSDIIGQMLSVDYAPPQNATMEHHLAVMLFYFHAFDAGADVALSMRMSLSALKLASFFCGFTVQLRYTTSRIARTSESTNTKELNAEAAYQEVKAAIAHLSETSKYWHSKRKSDAWRIERIEEHLNAQHGVGVDQKSFRSPAAIKKDLARAKGEGLI